jgi:hypothetical protein
VRTVSFALEVPYHTAMPGQVPEPRLTVRLYSKERASPPILAIVDSGADESVFHIDVATYLGIDIATCVAETGYTATGEPFTTYRSPVTIETLGLHFNATVSFAQDLDPTEALLGRAEFFNEFLFAFDQRRRSLLVGFYGGAR